LCLIVNRKTDGVDFCVYLKNNAADIH